MENQQLPQMVRSYGLAIISKFVLLRPLSCISVIHELLWLQYVDEISFG
jgi:hypothetical protein